MLVARSPSLSKDGTTWDSEHVGQLSARTILITGANSGIGFATAAALVGRGAHVVLAVRDRVRGEAAAARLVGPGSSSVVGLDLSDLDQVARCAKRLVDSHEKIDGLVCNAGVMGGPLLFSAQGFELQMATNHLGHAALVSALWTVLEASAARVVMLSSNEAQRGRLTPWTTLEQLLKPDPYDGKQVYRNTKQANLLFAQQLHRRSKQIRSSVRAVGVHPGTVSTNLFARQLDRSGRSRLGSISKILTSALLSSPETGARGTLWALDESTPSGAFIAPAGFGQLRGRPRLADVYDSASDPATARRLWNLTEEAVGPLAA
ncbi:MAG: SDR family NAD(P)-dependent oxidoreductase [Actinobacteria bacterium]|nr:SDR family NAD(P)-dependent oxidoreductase [Actinomycetota bacterium]